VEPPIQYSTTDDGVSIAYWELGDGFPLVIMPSLPFSHLQMEWQIPEWAAYYERLAQNFRIIRYDSRGIGLSDRDVVAQTFESHLADLEAVVEHLGLERFALLAIAHAGPVAIQYTAAFPQRVSHLIFWCSYFENKPPREDADWEHRLLRFNPSLYAQTLALTCAGWDRPIAAHALANLFRESVSQEAMAAILDIFRDIDASARLDQVNVPTLVMSRRSVTLVALRQTRALAQRVPGAHMAVLEGDSIAPWLGDAEPFFQSIEDFLPRRARHLEPEPAEQGGLRIILFTDLEGHTSMMQRLGDAAGRSILREHERLMRRAFAAHGGAEVKSMGDGFLASFTSAQKALECAIDLQRALTESPILGPDAPSGLRVRVGINAGEPISEDDDLFGNAVIAAARIATQARGGEVLVANVVRELVAGKGFLFADLGDRALRGFEDPVRLWELRWKDEE
jgi:class 3 adenylate cyclase/pimeloyl-ACP methyl ester carboxylesterase